MEKIQGKNQPLSPDVCSSLSLHLSSIREISSADKLVSLPGIKARKDEKEMNPGNERITKNIYICL